VAAVTLACGGDTTSPGPPDSETVASVEIGQPASAPLPGQTVQLTATPKTAAGLAIAGRAISWNSSVQAVASISDAGLVTGVTPGQTTITASADGVTGSINLTVLPVYAATCTECLEVVPGTLLLEGLGGAQQLVVFQVDATGNRTAVAATFESSNPSVVAVTPAGLATALSGLGSSQITAHAGNLTSAPVLALVAQPVAGAMLVSDDQIEGAMTPVDPDAPYTLGWQYRVRLRGAAPAVGQVVLGTGASPLGGRVVSVADAGGGKADLVLELLPLSGMFAAISINQQIPLDNAASVATPGGESRMLPTKASLSSVAGATNEIEFPLGPFKCKAKVEGALSFPLILDTFTFDLNSNLVYDVVVTDFAVQRAIVRGDISPRLTSDLQLNAAVKGGVDCKYTHHVLILPIGGPVSRFIGGQIPLGLGFAVEAKAEVAGLGYDAFLQATVTTEFGIDCAAICQVIGNLSSNAGGFFKPRFPASFNELRTELAVSLYGFAKLQFGSPLVNELQFETLELKAGLEQKAELASEKGQADDPAYASSFKLSPVIEAKTTSDLSALGGWLNIQFTALSFAPTLPALAQSPVGTFTISPDTVKPGNTMQVGDNATFTVNLNPVT
jgi:hypothetical protein